MRACRRDSRGLSWRFLGLPDFPVVNITARPSDATWPEKERLGRSPPSSRAAILALRFVADHPGRLRRSNLDGRATRPSSAPICRTGDLFPGSDPIGDEHVMIGKSCEQLRRLAEVGGKHISRVSRNPLRQIDALVDSGI